MSSTRFKSLIVACLALLGPGIGSARAVLIVGDSFEIYPTGILSGRNGGLTASGNWTSPYTANSAITTVAGGLSYVNGAIDIQGGGQNASLGLIGGTTDGVLQRSFDPQAGTLYFSLLFRPVEGLTTDDFVQFIWNDDADQNNALSIVMRDIFFVRARDGSTDTTGNSTTTAVDDTTYLLVGKATKSAGNYSRIDLFVNPSTLTEPVTPSATASRNTGSSTFSFFTMRVSALDSGDRYDFDALRIGTTYLDVVDTMPTSMVPEPSTWTIAAFGLVLPMAQRWRRRRRGS